MPPAAQTSLAESPAGAHEGRSVLLECLQILRLPLRILLTGMALAAVLGAGMALGLPGCRGHADGRGSGRLRPGACATARSHHLPPD